MTRCASLLLMVMIWGCGPGGLTLEQMKAPILDVVLPPLETNRWNNELSIRLSEAGEGCPDLSSDTKAFFNDKEMDMTVAGHWEDGTNYLVTETSGYCSDTSFYASKDELPKNLRDDVTRIRMTEGTVTFHAEAQAVCVPRSVKMSFPSDGVLRPGDEVTLVWEPATDELLVDRINLKPPSQSTTQRLAQLEDGTLRVEGNQMHFKMPPLQPFPVGRAEIMVFGRDRQYRPPVTRCEGFTECRFRCGMDVEWFTIPVTLKAG